MIQHNFMQVIIALDQLLHCLCGTLLGYAVYADESFSSYQYRRYLAGKDTIKRGIDTLFFWEKEHCRSAYESERGQRHLPPELRVLR